MPGIRNGDKDAFAEFYDRRARLVRALCYDATGDLHTATDLTQVTERRPKVKGAGSIYKSRPIGQRLDKYEGIGADTPGVLRRTPRV